MQDRIGFVLVCAARADNGEKPNFENVESRPSDGVAGRSENHRAACKTNARESYANVELTENHIGNYCSNVFPAMKPARTATLRCTGVCSKRRPSESRRFAARNVTGKFL